MSCDHTAAEARSASDPPGSVDNKMSLLIRPGCCKAMRLGNETTHRPPEHVYPLDTEHLNYSRAIIGEFSNIKWLPVVCGATDSAIVERISSLEDASTSINEGSQSALVAAKPFRTRSRWLWWIGLSEDDGR